MSIKRIDEIRTNDGALTHKMCCVCFKMTAVDSLWRDTSGQAWDLCGSRCASAAGE